MTKPEAVREAEDVARKLRRKGYPTRKYSLSCCFTVLFPDGSKQSLYYEQCRGQIPGCELGLNLAARRAAVARNAPVRKRKEASELKKAKRLIEELCIFIDSKDLGEEFTEFLKARTLSKLAYTSESSDSSDTADSADTAESRSTDRSAESSALES
jgi:hypothetical protein